MHVPESKPPAATRQAGAGIPYIRLSGFYFFYFCILGTLLPYWPLYLETIGFTPAQIGQLMAVLPAAKVLSPSLWGWLADRGGHTLRLIRWTAFLTLCTFGLMFERTSFLGLALATLAFSFFWNASLPLFETITLNHLRHDAHRYSRVRLWGSVGFIAAVWAVGESLDGFFRLACLPQLIALLFAVFWLSSLAVPAAGREPHGEEHGPLAGILRRGEVLALFAACLLLQVSHGPYYAFFSVYLQEHGYGGGQTGQLWALGVFAEILLFGVAHRLQRRYSLRGILVASLALSAVRWLVVAFGVGHIGWIVLAQVLHAASFGSAHVAAIQLIHRHFRGPHQAQGQALYSSISYGLGGALGSLYAGELWTAWGAQWVFAGAAGFSLLACLMAGWKVGKKSALHESRV